MTLSAIFLPLSLFCDFICVLFYSHMVLCFVIIRCVRVLQAQVHWERMRFSFTDVQAKMVLFESPE